MSSSFVLKSTALVLLVAQPVLLQGNMERLGGEKD